jgi:hypothetical protein
MSGTPIRIEIDGIKYEAPVIGSEAIKQHVMNKLRVEWDFEGCDRKANERALDGFSRERWSLEVIPLGSILLDPRVLNLPHFAKDAAEKTAYQVHKLDQGVAIEPIVMEYVKGISDLDDGYHRVMALRRKGKAFVLAYVGRD